MYQSIKLLIIICAICRYVCGAASQLGPIFAHCHSDIRMLLLAERERANRPDCTLNLERVTALPPKR